MAREMTTASGVLMTAKELERLSEIDRLYELVRGHLVVGELHSARHGQVAAQLNMFVHLHVEKHGLGELCGAGGFKLASNPDTVRAGDLAFVAADRVHQIPRRGYAELAPDLVGEVVDEDDRPGDVLAKVADWLNAGTRLVWVIHPRRGDAQVYRSDGTIALVGLDDALEGENVLPGFTCPLRDILE